MASKRAPATSGVGSRTKNTHAVRVGAGNKGEYGRLVFLKTARWKGGAPCRCSRCGKRRTLAKRPEWYEASQRKDVRARATCCGLRLKVDHYRRTGTESKGKICNCGQYIGAKGDYPHRRGSLFCKYGEAGSEGFINLDRNRPEFEEWLADRQKRRERALASRNDPVPF